MQTSSSIAAKGGGVLTAGDAAEPSRSTLPELRLLQGEHTTNLISLGIMMVEIDPCK